MRFYCTNLWVNILLNTFRDPLRSLRFFVHIGLLFPIIFLVDCNLFSPGILSHLLSSGRLLGSAFIPLFCTTTWELSQVNKLGQQHSSPCLFPFSMESFAFIDLLTTIILKNHCYVYFCFGLFQLGG